MKSYSKIWLYKHVKNCLFFIFLQVENPNPPSILNVNETTKAESQTTLVMCEELRKLNKFDSIIPQPLLNV